MAEEFDGMVSEYIEFLWEEGHSKSEASYALASIQFYRPQVKGHLVWSWKMAKAWSQLELPTRATPLTPELLMSLAGQAFKWQKRRMGWLLVLGFTGLLRTTEMLSLRKKDVILPSQPQSLQEAVLLLPSTKGLWIKLSSLRQLAFKRCATFVKAFAQGRLCPSSPTTSSENYGLSCSMSWSLMAWAINLTAFVEVQRQVPTKRECRLTP
eukprot:Skav226689  [mRNA]  locus=scaffold3971:127189:127818:- [translate_table: standard]